MGRPKSPGANRSKLPGHVDEHSGGEPAVLLAGRFAQPPDAEQLDERCHVDDVPSLGPAEQSEQVVDRQHLWCERDHLVFERHQGPAGGTAFIKFTGDEAAFEEAITALAERAVAAVLARRQEHGEGHEALRFVAVAGDDFNAGVALGLVGDVRAAAARLNGAIHPAYHAQAARYRDSLVHGQFEAIAATAVDQTRAHLKLPPVERTWHT